MSSTDAPMRKTFTVHVGAEAVAADTPCVLIDLSDTTNFPHSDTNWINLLGLILSADTATDGQYDIWVGVVTENDATDGSASWFHVFHLEGRNNATDDTGNFYRVADFTFGGANPDGINCKISSGSPVYFATVQAQAANANWQNDVGLLSPAGAGAGATGKPGVGDVVVWLEETAGAGTLDFSLTAIYEAH